MKAAGRDRLAVRDAGPGRAVLALSGSFDRAGLARLRDAVTELGRRGLVEVVVDLAGVGEVDERLVRALAHSRIRLLIAGVRVQWRGVPEPAAPALGAAAPAAFVVSEAR